MHRDTLCCYKNQKAQFIYSFWFQKYKHSRPTQTINGVNEVILFIKHTKEEASTFSSFRTKKIGRKNNF